MAGDLNGKSWAEWPVTSQKNTFETVKSGDAPILLSFDNCLEAVECVGNLDIQ